MEVRLFLRLFFCLSIEYFSCSFVSSLFAFFKDCELVLQVRSLVKELIMINVVFLERQT